MSPLVVSVPKIPRAYIARRLLEHGALTATEFREITRWPSKTVAKTLFKMTDAGLVQRGARAGCHHYEYRLA